MDSDDEMEALSSNGPFKNMHIPPSELAIRTLFLFAGIMACISCEGFEIGIFGLFILFLNGEVQHQLYAVLSIILIDLFL